MLVASFITPFFQKKSGLKDIDSIIPSVQKRDDSNFIYSTTSNMLYKHVNKVSASSLVVFVDKILWTKNKNQLLTLCSWATQIVAGFLVWRTTCFQNFMDCTFHFLRVGADQLAWNCFGSSVVLNTIIQIRVLKITSFESC